MRVVRALLACLLSLGIIVQGHASVRALEASCPMMHPAAAGSFHADMSMSAHHAHVEHGAHDTADTPQMEHCLTGEPADDTRQCTCIADCQPAGSLPLAFARAPVSVRIVRQAPAFMAPAFHSHTAFRHWRPPAPV